MKSVEEEQTKKHSRKKTAMRKVKRNKSGREIAMQIKRGEIFLKRRRKDLFGHRWQRRREKNINC